MMGRILKEMGFVDHSIHEKMEEGKFEVVISRDIAVHGVLVVESVQTLPPSHHS